MVRAVRRWRIAIGVIALALTAVAFLAAAARHADAGAQDRCFRTGGDLAPPIRIDEIQADWRLLPPGYDCVYLFSGFTVVKRPPSAAPASKQRYYKAEDFVAAGRRVPGVHPTLPFCSTALLQTPDGTMEAERGVSPCQAPRTGIFLGADPHR